MIVVEAFAGRPVAVLGLGKSGLSAARALSEGGAKLRAWDDDSDRRAAGHEAGVNLVDPKGGGWDGIALLVPSPGVPLDHWAVATARVAEVEIVGDVELLGRTVPEARYVGVTGTNGKSTTTALIGHILGLAGRPAAIGGNFGPPALDLDRLGPDGTYVLELSSYQLDLTADLAFDAAVLLNITPDHLERHGDMANYVAAKRRIFRRGDRDGAAIVGVDDGPSREIFEALSAEGQRRVIPVCVGQPIAGGVAVIDGVLHDATGGPQQAAERVVLDLAKAPALPGAHNWQNAAAAYATARALELDSAVAAEALMSFPGLAHRLETIATIDGTRYINDSKATNAEAAARALACFENIHWIAGGRAKAGGLEPIAPHLARVAHAFLIGEAEEIFAAALEGRVPYTRCGDLAAAVAEATAHAQGKTGAVVLLSPACASFDQWQDFEARGDAFRSLVAELADTVMNPPKSAGGAA